MLPWDDPTARAQGGLSASGKRRCGSGDDRTNNFVTAMTYALAAYTIADIFGGSAGWLQVLGTELAVRKGIESGSMEAGIEPGLDSPCPTARLLSPWCIIRQRRP